MKHRFLQFVILGMVLTITNELIGWFYLPSDMLQADFWLADGYAAVFDGGWPVYLFILMARLLIMAGLLAFDTLARTAFLVFTVISAFSTLLWGFRVTAPIQGPFLVIESMIDGVILAVAYFSSVSTEFRKNAT